MRLSVVIVGFNRFVSPGRGFGESRTRRLQNEEEDPNSCQDVGTGIEEEGSRVSIAVQSPVDLRAHAAGRCVSQYTDLAPRSFGLEQLGPTPGNSPKNRKSACHGNG